MAIKSVKVWNKGNETRVYVKNDKGFESVQYITGNNWNKPGARKAQGKWGLEDDEWQEAESLAIVDGQWTNYPPTPANRSGWGKCPDCGGYDCGPNCNSNR